MKKVAETGGLRGKKLWRRSGDEEKGTGGSIDLKMINVVSVVYCI